VVGTAGESGKAQNGRQCECAVTVA
jgi:hypothetical protein